MARHGTSVVPYETLLRLGLLEHRLDGLANTISELRDTVGNRLCELAHTGTLTWDEYGQDELRDRLTDEFWEQFWRDVARRVGVVGGEGGAAR